MISYSPRRPMRWNAAIGAIARCKATSIASARKRKSVRVWRWICGVKPTLKAVNKPWHHCIVHGLDKPGVFTTVSRKFYVSGLIAAACLMVSAQAWAGTDVGSLLLGGPNFFQGGVNREYLLDRDYTT